MVHHDNSPTNEYYVKGQKSRSTLGLRLGLWLGLGDRVAGVRYAPLSSACLVGPVVRLIAERQADGRVECWCRTIPYVRTQ